MAGIRSGTKRRRWLHRGNKALGKSGVHPGWPGDTPGLTIHHPSIRGCLPRVDGLEPEIPHAL